MPVFMFTDIEESTRLWEEHSSLMLEVLHHHDTILKQHLDRSGGSIIKHTGDGIYAVFPEGNFALHCALLIQRQIAETDWGEVGDINIRIGLDARSPEQEGKDYFTDGSDYFGPAINCAARIMSAGWGGQILFSSSVLNIAALPDDAKIQDFGDHKLKGIQQPQHIFGLLHSALAQNTFPPLRSSVQETSSISFDRPPLQLPPRVAHFINRRDETQNLMAELQPGRVITICGPGGIGKTSLVAEVLWQMVPEKKTPERFPDGIFFHSFYDQPQTALALEEISRVFSTVSTQGNQTELARRALSGKRALIVLDGAESTDNLDAVLDVRGSCCVLVTSRRKQDAVSIRQDITSLSLAEAEKLLRAWGGVRAGNQVAVKQICILVGGFPLALRLIGRYLATQEEEIEDYLTWLREAPLAALDLGERQSESIPLLIAKSLDEISQTGRAILSIIGMLALAPFAREVIEALGLPDREVSKTLGELVNYGLLVRSGEKYSVSHALIHTYARQKLEPPDELASKLTAYYLTVARSSSESDDEAHTQLDTKRPHLMTILARLSQQGKWEKVQDLSKAIDPYLEEEGRWVERTIALQAGLTSVRLLGQKSDEKNLANKLLTTYQSMGVSVSQGEEIASSTAESEINLLKSIVETPQQLIADRYEMVGTYTGGMGIVHLCRDHQTGQLVALKTFRPEYLPSRAARDLFLREGTTWVSLGKYPHIVRAHRVERIGDGREVYIVLDWILQPYGKNSPSLRSWLQDKQPLPIKQALRYVLHIARGMKYATTKIQGFIHRDLKPENILIGFDDVARVTDFGLASTLTSLSSKVGERFFLSPSADVTQTQLIRGKAGTPRYMAPEQWLNKPLSLQTDIYSFGCILYEIVTGQFAAQGSTIEELEAIHTSGDIQFSQLNVPREIKAFLLWCLRTDPSQRFNDWNEVVNALMETYRLILGETPPAERSFQSETRAERLAKGESFNQVGLSYLDIGKLPTAVKYFEQAILTGRAEKEVNLESEGLGHLGLAYMRLGYLNRAYEFHNEQLTIARQYRNQSHECQALGNLGRVCLQMNRPDKAFEFHRQELDLARNLAERSKEAHALESIGDYYIQSKNIKSAAEQYESALAIARSIRNQARIMSLLRKIGQIHFLSGNTQKAEAYLKQSLEQANKYGDRVAQGIALTQLGHLNQSLGLIDQAIKLYEDALNIAQETSNRRRVINNAQCLGDIYLQNDKLLPAVTMFELMLSTSQDIDLKASEVDAFDRLGQIHLKLGDSWKSINMHRRALTLVKALKDRVKERQIIYNLGVAYERYGDLTRAADYFQEYRTILQESGDLEHEMAILDKLAILYKNLDHRTSALQAYSDQRGIAKKLDSREEEAKTLKKIGDVLLDFRRPKDAIEIYRDALNIVSEFNNHAIEIGLLSNLGLAYYVSDDARYKWRAVRTSKKAVSLANQTSSPEFVARAELDLASLFLLQGRKSKARTHLNRAAMKINQLKNKELSKRLQVLQTKAKNP